MFEVLCVHNDKYSSSSDDELTVASKLYLISSSGRRYSAHPINERRQTFQYLLIGIEGNRYQACDRQNYA
jgi:hypothetical protein